MRIAFADEAWWCGGKKCGLRVLVLFAARHAVGCVRMDARDHNAGKGVKN